MLFFNIYTHELRKALKSGGVQRLNMVDLYGKNLRSYKSREAMVPLSLPLGSYDYMSVHMSYHNLKKYIASHNDHLNNVPIL